MIRGFEIEAFSQSKMCLNEENHDNKENIAPKVLASAIHTSQKPRQFG